MNEFSDHQLLWWAAERSMSNMATTIDIEFHDVVQTNMKKEARWFKSMDFSGDDVKQWELGHFVSDSALVFNATVLWESRMRHHLAT